MSWWISRFLCGFLPDWMRFKRLLKFPSCHSYPNKGKAGNSFLTYLRSRRKNSHFSGISHAQTPAMATRINLLPLDQVSRSRENIQIFKLLRGSLTINFDTAGQRSLSLHTVSANLRKCTVRGSSVHLISMKNGEWKNGFCIFNVSFVFTKERWE